LPPPRHRCRCRIVVVVGITIIIIIIITIANARRALGRAQLLGAEAKLGGVAPKRVEQRRQAARERELHSMDLMQVFFVRRRRRRHAGAPLLLLLLLPLLLLSPPLLCLYVRPVRHGERLALKAAQVREAAHKHAHKPRHVDGHLAERVLLDAVRRQRRHGRRCVNHNAHVTTTTAAAAATSTVNTCTTNDGRRTPPQRLPERRAKRLAHDRERVLAQARARGGANRRRRERGQRVVEQRLHALLLRRRQRVLGGQTQQARRERERAGRVARALRRRRLPVRLGKGADALLQLLAARAGRRLARQDGLLLRRLGQARQALDSGS
jgi:hypothetical protein